MGTRLYVGNLPYDTSEQELQEIFAQVGPVASIALPTDPGTGRMRGFGFVDMTTEEDAQAAIARLNGTTTIRQRQLTINEARPREDRGGSGNRGGSRGYSRY